jgi:hypothetical protein
MRCVSVFISPNRSYHFVLAIVSCVQALAQQHQWRKEA